MRKKEIKGYLTFSISMMLIISACSSKPAVITPIPTKAPIESINPNDISIPGLTDDILTPTVDPNAVTPTVDPNASIPTADPNATVDPTVTATATNAPVTCSAQISGDLNAIAGSVSQLTAQNKCSDGTLGADTFTWVSSDVNIATVDNTGKVTGVKVGSVNITATSSLNSAVKTSVQFKVSNTCSIALSGDLKNNPELGLNSAKQLTAAITCNDGSSGNVSWTTSDASVATVGTSGLVEGKKKGNVIITAKLQSDASISVSLAVTVIDPNGNEIRPTIGQGKLNKPIGIDSRNGKLYVTHIDDGTIYDDGRVKTFDTSGNKGTEIKGSYGSSLPVDLNGVAMDGSRVWIINRIPYAQSKNNIYSFDSSSSGRLDGKAGLTGAEGTDFRDVAIDPSTSTLYISSGGVRSVIKVNYNSSGIRNDTQQLYFAGANLNPAGICVDNFGNLMVTNAGANPPTITKYGKEGTKALEFNTKGKNSTGPTATGIGDVAYDSNNNGIIYVLAVVGGSNVILRYDADGNFVRSFGADAGMQSPELMAVSSDGTLYVTDSAKNLVHQFGPGK